MSSARLHDDAGRIANSQWGIILINETATEISVYGAPEFQLARVASVGMGRFYGLPTWGYAGHSDGNVMNEAAS